MQPADLRISAWEIDFFGGIRREIEAAEANLEATEEALRDTLITLQAEVARNYVDLRGQQLRLAIAQKERENWQANVEIAEARYAAGLISHLELSRAQGELAIRIASTTLRARARRLRRS